MYVTLPAFGGISLYPTSLIEFHLGGSLRSNTSLKIYTNKSWVSSSSSLQNADRSSGLAFSPKRGSAESSMLLLKWSRTFYYPSGVWLLNLSWIISQFSLMVSIRFSKFLVPLTPFGFLSVTMSLLKNRVYDFVTSSIVSDVLKSDFLASNLSRGQQQ